MKEIYLEHTLDGSFQTITDNISGKILPTTFKGLQIINDTSAALQLKLEADSRVAPIAVGEIYQMISNERREPFKHPDLKISGVTGEVIKVFYWLFDWQIEEGA
jgi:hypothetical protein